MFREMVLPTWKSQSAIYDKPHWCRYTMCSPRIGSATFVVTNVNTCSVGPVLLLQQLSFYLDTTETRENMFHKRWIGRRHWRKRVREAHSQVRKCFHEEGSLHRVTSRWQPPQHAYHADQLLLVSLPTVMSHWIEVCRRCLKKYKTMGLLCSIIIFTSSYL